MRLFAPLFALGLGLAAPLAQAADSYMFDKGHTTVRATWNHAGLSMQSLNFRDIGGEVKIDLETPANSSLNVVIPLSSIDTGVEAFDRHLASGDFFETDKHPEATFVSTSIEKTGEMTLKVMGDLTIKGVSKPVALDVEVHAVGEHPLGQFIDYYKGEWVGLTAKGTVVRSEWGLGFGAPITSDEVELFISTEMKKL